MMSSTCSTHLRLMVTRFGEHFLIGPIGMNRSNPPVHLGIRTAVLQRLDVIDVLALECGLAVLLDHPVARLGTGALLGVVVLGVLAIVRRVVVDPTFAHLISPLYVPCGVMVST